MPGIFWLIVVLIAFKVLLGRRRRYDRRMAYQGPHPMYGPQMRAEAAAREAMAQRTPPKLPEQTTEEALRRVYVEGLITDEEYEEKLDRLYRKS